MKPLEEVILTNLGCKYKLAIQKGKVWLIYLLINLKIPIPTIISIGTIYLVYILTLWSPMVEMFMSMLAILFTKLSQEQKVWVTTILLPTSKVNRWSSKRWSSPSRGVYHKWHNYIWTILKLWCRPRTNNHRTLIQVTLITIYETKDTL